MCYLCKKEFNKKSEFRNHVLVNHQSDYNCQECDFQAGASKIILSKHMNLRHRQESEQTNDTLKCDECNMHFSSKWSCNNHKRDKHEMKKDCIFFNQGSCRFPETCWNRHIKENSAKEPAGIEKPIECFVCKKIFKTKYEMMLHRKSNHPEKVRDCNNPDNCVFTNCWYIHGRKQSEVTSSVVSETNIETEQISEGNFQMASTPLIPPLGQENINNV